MGGSWWRRRAGHVFRREGLEGRGPGGPPWWVRWAHGGGRGQTWRPRACHEGRGQGAWRRGRGAERNEREGRRCGGIPTAIHRIGVVSTAARAAEESGELASDSLAAEAAAANSLLRAVPAWRISAGRAKPRVGTRVSGGPEWTWAHWAQGPTFVCVVQTPKPAKASACAGR